MCSVLLTRGIIAFRPGRRPSARFRVPRKAHARNGGQVLESGVLRLLLALLLVPMPSHAQLRAGASGARVVPALTAFSAPAPLAMTAPALSPGVIPSLAPALPAA